MANGGGHATPDLLYQHKTYIVLQSMHQPTINHLFKLTVYSASVATGGAVLLPGGEQAPVLSATAASRLLQVLHLPTLTSKNVLTLQLGGLIFRNFDYRFTYFLHL